MKELIDKVTSYNLFNYLLPGILYVYIVAEITTINFKQNDILIGVFFYYFLGLTISIFGSTVIEPLLRKVQFVNFSEYRDFVKATKVDSKIEILSEANNMYRNLIALFLLIGITKLYCIIELKFPFIRNYSIIAIILVFFLMFLFAYRKQTNYITKRINTNQNEHY